VNVEDSWEERVKRARYILKNVFERNREAFWQATSWVCVKWNFIHEKKGKWTLCIEESVLKDEVRYMSGHFEYTVCSRREGYFQNRWIIFKNVKVEKNTKNVKE
jgi:hypothetical protein